MKQIGLLALAIFLGYFQVQAQAKKQNNEMAFEKTVDGVTAHDFGSIVYGANGKVDFNFTNKGTKPLVISDVKSSCGCTVPSWTKEPVAPGKTGTVTVVYNTKLPGVFNKTVVVYSNANNSPVRLEIRGKVNARPSDIQATQSTAGKNGKEKELQLESNKEIPMDSAAKAQASIAEKARMAAQEASLKKLMQADTGKIKTTQPVKVTKEVTQTEVSGTAKSGKSSDKGSEKKKK